MKFQLIQYHTSFNYNYRIINPEHSHNLLAEQAFIPVVGHWKWILILVPIPISSLFTSTFKAVLAEDVHAFEQVEWTPIRVIIRVKVAAVAVDPGNEFLLLLGHFQSIKYLFSLVYKPTLFTFQCLTNPSSVLSTTTPFLHARTWTAESNFWYTMIDCSRNGGANSCPRTPCRRHSSRPRS